jgi:TetR/AcrR family transcriptional regulator
MESDTRLDARERISECAAGLFAERGFAAVSMREIAEAADVSKPMLYYYFDSKDGLFRALIESGLQRTEESIKHVRQLPVSTSERLRVLARDRYQFVRQQPKIVKLFLDLHHGPDASGLFDEFADRMHAPINQLSDLIREAQNNGELRSDINSTTLALAFLGTINVFVHLHFAFGYVTLDTALADQLVSQFVDGAAVVSVSN